MVEQHGLEEAQIDGKCCRRGNQNKEDGDARPHRDLRHGKRPHAQDGGPAVHEEHGLLLIKALGDEPVVDVAPVCLANAHVGTTAAHDGREGVHDGDARDDEGHDERGEAGDACHGEKRDRAERKAEKQRA